MKELKASAVQAASRFLSRRGYDILATDWKSAAATADIVSKDGEALVFVKVRTRTGTEAGFPSECRGAAERTERERVALAYLAEHDTVNMFVRFDDVSMVVVAPDRAMIRHHINSMYEELSDRALQEGFPHRAIR